MDIGKIIKIKRIKDQGKKEGFEIIFAKVANNEKQQNEIT